MSGSDLCLPPSEGGRVAGLSSCRSRAWTESPDRRRSVAEGSPRRGRQPRAGPPQPGDLGGGG